METDREQIDEPALTTTRVVPMPGVRLGKSLIDWFAIPKDSPGHDDYHKRLREVDEAECAAYQAAQGVIVR